LSATAIPGFLKYPGLVVRKKTGFGFGKTRIGNTIDIDDLRWRWVQRLLWKL